jgi:RNA polymerase sigma-70 factor (ECF subfamily)
MGDIEAPFATAATAGTMERAETPEAVLDRIYDQYARQLYRYALAVTGSPDDAEDAVQEVFVRLARSIRRLPRVADLKAYLFSSTRNAACDILRARQRGGRLGEALQLEARVAGQCEVSSRDGSELCEAMLALPVEQREILVLKVFEEMTFKEIAAVLGVSINTVASRYRYAIGKLRGILEAQDDGR